MKPSLPDADHGTYRETLRELLAREVVPHQETWDREHRMDRQVFALAAKAGLYVLQIGEQYGDAREPDYRYRMVVWEEIARINALPFGLTMSQQDDLVLHYPLDLTIDEQKQRWRGFAAGELIGAIALTEPGAGGDRLDADDGKHGAEDPVRHHRIVRRWFGDHGRLNGR